MKKSLLSFFLNLIRHNIKISQNQSLYAVGALGSRGFSSSFLCGEVVANQIRNGFIPVDYEVLKNLEV